jgi:hypothetical protein
MNFSVLIGVLYKNLEKRVDSVGPELIDFQTVRVIAISISKKGLIGSYVTIILK